MSDSLERRALELSVSSAPAEAPARSRRRGAPPAGGSPPTTSSPPTRRQAAGSRNAAGIWGWKLPVRRGGGPRRPAHPQPGHGRPGPERRRGGRSPSDVGRPLHRRQLLRSRNEVPGGFARGGRRRALCRHGDHGPGPPRRHLTPVLLAGPHADAAREPLLVWPAPGARRDRDRPGIHDQDATLGHGEGLRGAHRRVRAGCPPCGCVGRSARVAAGERSRHRLACARQL